MRMKTNKVHLELDGTAIVVDGLDAQERRLLTRLQRRARAHPDWCDFDNYWMAAVVGLYDERGSSRAETIRTPLYRIAQDLSMRLGIAQGMIQPATELDQLEDLVLNHFSSRRAFCKASGLPAKLLDDVLAGRKDMPLTMLRKALERIGYQLRILPSLSSKRAKRTG
jgi:hypothetical protein